VLQSVTVKLLLSSQGKPRIFASCSRGLRSEIFPSSPRRGGCAIKKKLRSILSRADGVVISYETILLGI
jgi:hypothetical protein